MQVHIQILNSRWYILVSYLARGSKTDLKVTKCHKQPQVPMSSLKESTVKTTVSTFIIFLHTRYVISWNLAKWFIIFHQPIFPWNSRGPISLPQLPLRGNRLCEVTIIWPDVISTSLKAPRFNFKSMVVSGSPKRWYRWHITPQKARTISGIYCQLGDGLCHRSHRT